MVGGKHGKDVGVATQVLLQYPGIWGAVTAAAEALLRQNVLTWDEVLALMDDSGPQDPLLEPGAQTGNGFGPSQRGSQDAPITVVVNWWAALRQER
jgi:hypothetical protein